MTYRVILPKRVQKELDRLPSVIHDRIIATATKLEENPRPSGCLKLGGRNAWRIRVGEYRIIYEIDDAKQLVVVTTIAHRKEVYRR